ncbi:hypothetical protein HDC90_002146 [Pedobacter sp. AK013]|uniref:hypothetical protein n=1 Tax=Pedobacter sp. AK013 TaxID=2723071 RepID=UPI001613B81C|nr:hypothetical protein [Pedobacter sp. AK013]MBB6237524.1 hypothetical protein [Pedobacter sp. AK013]
MKFIKILIINVILFQGCALNKKKIENCNKDQAKILADKRMKRRGFNLKYYKVMVANESDCYRFEYRLKTVSLGGGGTIKIAKGDCRILSELFYQ